jgi:hypothetical protein
MRCQTKGHITGTATEIQGTLPKRGLSKRHEAAFPVPMKPKTLQIINQIISWSNSIKEILYPFRSSLITGKIALGHEATVYHEYPCNTVLKKFFQINPG